jgi:hypothetical protein
MWNSGGVRPFCLPFWPFWVADQRQETLKIWVPVGPVLCVPGFLPWYLDDSPVSGPGFACDEYSCISHLLTLSHSLKMGNKLLWS